MQFNSKANNYCRYKMNIKRIKIIWCFNILVIGIANKNVIHQPELLNYCMLFFPLVDSGLFS